MPVKAGQIIHVGNNVALVDRLQTAGPGNVNIRRETIYELGNYRSVGTVADIPDLSFQMESFDVSCEVEAFLLRKPVGTTHSYDLAQSRMCNVKGAIKGGETSATPYDTVASAAIPGLRLEQMQYRFGVGNNSARQTATLRGSELYWNPGSCYIQEAVGSGSAGQQVVLTNPAYGTTEGGVTRHTLAVTAGDTRLVFGADYTETVGALTNGAGSVTVTILAAVPATDTIAVVYSSPTVESFPQTVHALVSGVASTLSGATIVGAVSLTLASATGFAVGDTIIIDTGANAELAVISNVAGAVLTVPALVNAHASGVAVAQYVPIVKPAAIRGRDIDIFIGPASPIGTAHATARGAKRTGVQSADVDWRVQLQMDEELGNYHYTNVDFFVPEVSGNLTFRPRDIATLLALVRELGGNTDANQSTGLSGSPLLDVQVAIKNPVDGRVLKRLHIPDARFNVPGYQGRVQQKLDLQSPFKSDTGTLFVYDN